MWKIVKKKSEIQFRPLLLFAVMNQADTRRAKLSFETQRVCL
jgi:hypothetical protein